MVLRALAAHLKGVSLGEKFVRRNPLYYGRIWREVARLDDADMDQRKAWTDARLRQTLRLAARTPYGREVGGTEDIATWPLLDKERLRDGSLQFHSHLAWAATQARTGGTTGTPVNLLRSPQSVVAEQVFIDRLFDALGADPVSGRIAALRGDDIKDPTDLAPPFWRYTLGGRRLLLSSNHLSSSTLNHYVDELRKFEPDVLWAYPSALESLCRLIGASGHLRIPRILLSSEVLSPAAWSQVRHVLGCQIVDYYGQAERVAFAQASQAKRYRFSPGYSYLELLPQGSDGKTEAYEVVGTSLWNAAMPLVRYRTGDVIHLYPGSSDYEVDLVANGLRDFEGVVGRDGDVLFAPDGRVLTGIDHIQRGVEHVARIQIVQPALDQVQIRVMPGPGFGTEDQAALERNARAKIPRSMDLSVEVADTLVRTSQGKTPFVIHEPAVLQARTHRAGSA